jgi:hypothetical protein
MTRGRVPAALRRAVRDRADGRREYCQYPEWASAAAFHADHVVAGKHGGPTSAGNLAWTCPPCNRRKGTDLTTLDPATARKVGLFNPRVHQWSQHFRTVGAQLRGRTAIGRATVQLLNLNSLERVAERARLGRLKFRRPQGLT